MNSNVTQQPDLASLLSDLLTLVRERVPRLESRVADLEAENAELKRKLAAIPGRGYSEKQAAVRLGGISVEALRRLRRTGQIGFSRIGTRIVYTRRDLDEYLEKHGLPAGRFNGLRRVS